MKITVTQEDIDKGLPNRCYECPVSLAVKRALGARDVSVSWTITAHVDGEILKFNKTDPITRFVAAFDARQPVQPFEFELV